MAKVVLGLSGGVDSAVAARLLQGAGYAVHGLYMNNGSDAALRDAVSTAEYLGVPLKILEMRDALEKNVCAPFAQSYLRGETPNPCILCNPTVKFPSLLSFAEEIGAEFVATGHYAKTENGRLFKGHPANDQSYMLCRLTEGILRRTLFPLGDLAKAEVRQMAGELAIPVAKKPDSMEICFIPDKDYAAWLFNRGFAAPEGPVVFEGETVARHSGIHRCTVGQRWPGLFAGKKLYIASIDPRKNTVYLSEDGDLYKTLVLARDFNWINGAPGGEVEGTVRVRHTKFDTACRAKCVGDRVEISCAAPVRAPAPGQSAVIYEGSRVLGGGYIENSSL